MSAVGSPRGSSGPFTAAYQGFGGLDTSRDINAMDTGNNQHLVVLNNAYADWRGQITKDPSATLVAESDRVLAVRFFTAGEVAWAAADERGVRLRSQRGHASDYIWPNNAVVTSTVFDRKAIFFCRALPAYQYDGNRFELVPGSLNRSLFPAFGTTIQQRLAVAGVPGQETKVLLSRTRNASVFDIDEPADSEDVLRAGFLDVANLFGTADVITGLVGFEQNRLAIFSADKTLIYRIDPDIEQWAIEDRANINVGCVSHNTIAKAGNDVLFCSRSGVHTLSRSDANGLTVFSNTLSDKIDVLYRKLVRSVTQPSLISAVFDQDEGRYHIFFPQPGGVITKRLSLSLNPEGGEPRPTWSTGDFLNARCGDFLAGNLSFGGPDGVYALNNIEDTIGQHPEVTFETPWLFNGSLDEDKNARYLTIQAYGSGTIFVEAINSEDRVFFSDRIEIDPDEDDGSFIGVPLFTRYRRKFEHRYRAARFRFRIESKGLFRMTGFAIDIMRQ